MAWMNPRTYVTTLEAIVVAGSTRWGLSELLHQLRATCDVVRVCVDGASPEAGEIRSVAHGCRADRVSTLPEVGWIERVLPEIYGAVECDWAIRLDDDELLSEPLAEFLSILRSRGSPGPDFYRIARAWISSPDRSGYLSAPAWWPDVQLRLFRRGACHHGGVVHEGPIGLGTPGLLLDAPILHLNPLKPRRDREAAVARYHSIDPAATQGDMQLWEGRPDAVTRRCPWPVFEPARSRPQEVRA